MSRGRVLFVDDDDSFRDVLTRELVSSGFEVNACADGEEALAQASEYLPDAALLDLRLPGIDGLEVLDKLLEEDPDLQVVLLTGHGAVPEAVQAMRRGAYDFLTKPSPLDVVEQTLLRALERRSLIEDNRRLRRVASGLDEDYELIGSSDAMERLRRDISRMAPTPNNILILGENGTGKELVARNLHLESERSGRPFVTVNCGAISETLIESELFGHARGAFTGADTRRPGLFEAAHEGTLFLDEVGELPTAMQPALLRAVQFGEIREVGTNRAKKVDVRVISASNRDLMEEVKSGQFRQDLYYRLATLRLEVPPLRTRGSDVVELAEHFLDRAAGKMMRRMRLSEDAREELLNHPWWGNVRELDSTMIQLSVLCDHDEIGADQIRERLDDESGSRMSSLPTLRIEELERLAVEQALQRFEGDKKSAAEALGVSLKTLYNKLDKYRLR